jgi:hypothetical protein
LHSWHARLAERKKTHILLGTRQPPVAFGRSERTTQRAFAKTALADPGVPRSFFKCNVDSRRRSGTASEPLEPVTCSTVKKEMKLS